VQRDLSIDQPSERTSKVRPQARDRVLVNAMPIGTRRPPFDGVTLCLHWATALLVLGMFVSAWLHELAEASESLYAAAFIQVHRSLGAAIWVATTLRLAWRLTNAELPPFPVDMTKLHRIIVQISEYILYTLCFSFSPRQVWVWRFSAGVPSRSSCGVFHNCCLKTKQCRPRFIQPMKSGRGRLRRWRLLMPPPPCFTTSSFATTCFTAWRP
jgi:hypothetical protein